MKTRNEIIAEIKALLPSSLFERYEYLEFSEMAELPELSEWRKQPLDAASAWKHAW